MAIASLYLVGYVQQGFGWRMTLTGERDRKRLCLRGKSATLLRRGTQLWGSRQRS
jgi:hypothetical protein